MKTKLLTVLFFLLFLIPSASHSQFKPQKFGKLTPEELNLKVYSKDSSAKALILFDKGKSSYSFIGGNFKVVFTQHKRIKILKKEGENLANVSIVTYGNNSENGQSISSFKAFTYNIENGANTKSKVEKSQIFKEKVNENVSAMKFAFPNVKEGSIIEYEITIESSYNLNINDWEFQSEVPCCWSEYTVSIPEYFIFNKHTKGYLPFKEINTTYESKSVQIGNSQPLMYSEKVDHFVMENVPAFEQEPFIDSENNYISQVNYEISTFQVPGYQYKNYNSTWEDISQKLLDDTDFGGQLKSTGFYKEDLTAAIKNDTSYNQMLNSIFTLVKSKVKWNSTVTKWAKDGVKKAYRDGIGNSAEINLLLVNMLREANITAYPVVLSTRGNGLLRFGNPSISKMNYVVAMAEIGDKRILLDATSPASVPGILPFDCLNDNGIIVDKNNHEWIELIPSTLSKENNTALFKISEDGTINGQFSSSKTDQNAYEGRGTYRTMKEEDLKKMIASKIGDGAIENLKIDNLNDNIDKPFVFKFDFSIPSKATITDKNIFINPFVWDRYTSNPFKLEKRTYPINFGYPKQEKYLASIQIPEGYTVEELPQNIAIGNQEKTFTIVCNYTTSGNQITLSMLINIKKHLFVSSDYEELKELFNILVKKQSEQIVLKKS